MFAYCYKAVLSILTWEPLVICIVIASNIWVTAVTCLMVYSAVVPVVFDFFEIAVFAMALIVWGLVGKFSPTTTVSDSVITVRHLNTLPGIVRAMRIILLFWPLAVIALYKGYKYRELKVVTIWFGKSRMFGITLAKDRYEQHKDLGVSEDDIKEYMVLHNNEYLFKNDEALSYMIIKYHTSTILRSFGFLGGLDPNPVASFSIGRWLVGPDECPLIAKTANELGETYAMQTPQSVCDRIVFI